MVIGSSAVGLRHATAPRNVADDMSTLVEKNPDADILRIDDRLCRPRLMELEVKGQTGAACGEKNPPASDPAQRLPRPDLRDPYRCGRAAHSQAEQGLLLPGLPRAATYGREGTAVVQEDYVHVCLDQFGGRSGAGDGDDRHLQQPSQPAVRRDRRQGECLPWPSDLPYLWIDTA